MIAATLGLAWSVAGVQNDPGDGAWHDDVLTLVGFASSAPYPILRVVCDKPGQPVETILLVSAGKHGARESVAGCDGRIVRMRGRILERGGWRMLELGENDAPAADESMSAADASRLAPSSTMVKTIGQVVLRGEIIDPKCYSGAMKPGEGKTHKECATLCIAGGIPPMLVTCDSIWKRSYYLLTDSNGGPLAGDVLRTRVLPYVADAIEVAGELEIWDDQARLRIDPSAIHRL